MNNGKICIPICAETLEEMNDRCRQASAAADVVELRLDCLPAAELRRFQITGNSKTILTLRPREQGGGSDNSSAERSRFWASVQTVCGADLEEDVLAQLTSENFDPLICSFHDFSGEPLDLASVYERLATTLADVIKIAVQANDISKTIDIWKLLAIAKADRRPIIPIAMGEAGKWTRILGLAHGAYLTYASFESGSETAPGQISADEMVNVFRVKELDESTDVYGIIAGNTSYTMSPYVHNAAFKAAGLNSVFVPLQVSDLDEFVRRMVRPETREVELNFKGFSVTNPHKQAIIDYLDDLDDAARKIGAVNTVKVIDGKLHGYNTDAPGFIEPLKAKLGDLAGSRVAVFGAGGAARAVVYSLKNEGSDVTIFARDANKAKAFAEEFEIEVEPLPINNARINADIVVNATPLGTKGEFADATAATAKQLDGVKLVYDLVYNPAETRLLKEAKAAGAETLNGFDMLIAQAVRQFEIWTGQKAPAEDMAAAARKRLA